MPEEDCSLYDIQDMAEASIYDRASEHSDHNSKKTIRDVCKILERLQDGQGRPEKQMEDVTCTLRLLAIRPRHHAVNLTRLILLQHQETRYNDGEVT